MKSRIQEQRVISFNTTWPPNAKLYEPALKGITVRLETKYVNYENLHPDFNIHIFFSSYNKLIIDLNSATCS